MSTYSDDLALALQLADAADLISMSRYQSQDLVVTTNDDSTVGGAWSAVCAP